MSSSNRAAPEGPIPLSLISPLPGPATSAASCFLAVLTRSSMALSSSTSSAASSPAGLADHITGRRVGEQGAGRPRGQRLLRLARHQLDQQPLQPVDSQRAGSAELVAPVGQQPQRHRAVIEAGLPQRPGPQRDHGDRTRPLPELPSGRQQQPVTLAVGAEPVRHHRLPASSSNLNGRGPLVRIHPDHDPVHQHAPSPSSDPAIDGGGQRYLERAHFPFKRGPGAGMVDRHGPSSPVAGWCGH